MGASLVDVAPQLRQPWDSLLFAALVAVIVAFNRKHCFDKTAGAVERLVSISAPHASPVKLV